GRLRIEDADPADAHALGPGREPEVLHRQAGAEQVRLRHRPAAQHERSVAAAVAGDGYVERRLQNPFQLQPAVKFLSLWRRHLLQFRAVALLEGRPDLAAHY